MEHADRPTLGLYVQPEDDHLLVSLYRLPKGNRTALLWRQTTMRGKPETGSIEDALNDLYTAVMCLIEDQV